MAPHIRRNQIARNKNQSKRSAPKAVADNQAGKKPKRRAVPDAEKDEKYWERRRRNTLAVRRNRLRKKLLGSGADPSTFERTQIQLHLLN